MSEGKYEGLQDRMRRRSWGVGANADWALSLSLIEELQHSRDSAVAYLREIAEAAALPYCAHQGIKARDWLREHGLEET